MIVLTELHYLPGTEYFANILSAEGIMAEVFENFQKQTFRNRCRILGANKVEDLIVPVKHKSPKMSIKETEIDYGQRWLPVHWGAICSAYGKSPFFDYYISDFETVFKQKNKFLLDFNINLLTLCLKFLQINIPVHFTTGYQINKNNAIVDLRDTIKPKGIKGINSVYEPCPYIQNFGKQFVPALSIIDLLFCEGNHAKEVLKQSKRPKEQNIDFHC